MTAIDIVSATLVLHVTLLHPQSAFALIAITVSRIAVVVITMMKKDTISKRVVRGWLPLPSFASLSLARVW